MELSEQLEKQHQDFLQLHKEHEEHLKKFLEEIREHDKKRDEAFKKENDERIRDMIASRAMHAYIIERSGKSDSEQESNETLAIYSYRMADEMIIARDKK